MNRANKRSRPWRALWLIPVPFIAALSIIATGGGAFMDLETRKSVKENALSVWLRADPEVLHQRTKKSKTRPLLNNGDPLQTLKDLADKRYPTYAEADVTVETGHESLEATISKVMDVITTGNNEGSKK